MVILMSYSCARLGSRLQIKVDSMPMKPDIPYNFRIKTTQTSHLAMHSSTRSNVRITGLLTVLGAALLSIAGHTLAADAVVSDSLALSGEFALPVDEDRSFWVTVGDRSGIRLENQQGELLDHWDQPAEYLDQRSVTTPSGTRSLFASMDPDAGRVLLYTATQGQEPMLEQQFTSDPLGFPVQGMCLHQDRHDRLHLFVLNERFSVHQYLLMQESDPHSSAWRMTAVRTLPLGAEAEFCSVDDENGMLFVSEGEFAIWAYATDPEEEVNRSLVDAAGPFGNLGEGVLGVAAAHGTLYAMSADGPTLHVLRSNEGQYEWVSSQPFPSAGSPAGAAESTLLAVTGDKLHLTSYDEDRQLHSWLQLTTPRMSSPTTHLPEVLPSGETAPMPQWGDAADDPAVWLHPRNPGQSLVLGTNKRQGLFVYDLSGKEQQRLDIGRLNNVDVRYNVRWQGQDVDLAAASNRSTNAISLFAIHRDSRQLTLVTEIPTTLPNVYGLCLYQHRETGSISAFINDEDGRYQQYRIDADDERWSGTLQREFGVQSQPEGCVANDRTGQLFIGEEDVGIWVTGADPDDEAVLEPVAMVGDLLHDDVEGLAIYSTPQADYLLASSQGNNSYVLFEAVPPFRPLSAFRIGMSVQGEQVIDGASETDGLEVISANLGGIYAEGILVVQDGRNVTPEQPQNFKLVPWRDVRALLPH